MRHFIFTFFIVILLCTIIIPSSVLGATNKFSSTIDTSNWMSVMKDHIYNNSLSEITIPGTHDSGTFELQGITGPGQDKYLEEVIELAARLHIPVFELIENWSRSQNTTLYEQLMGGIRYIDMRVCWILNDWYTQHFVIGAPTQVLLNQIRDFISNHTGEVIVVELGDFDGVYEIEQEVLLINMIKNTLGPWLATVQDLRTFTIGEMVATNQRIILITPPYVLKNLNNATLYNYLWNTTEYVAGSYADKDELSDMVAWNTNEIFTQGGPGVIFELSWTLTPTPGDIVKRILDPFDHIKNLKDMAIIADDALNSFIQKYHNFRPGNIILVDWWQETSVIDIALSQNLRCGDNPNYIQVNPQGQYCRNFFLHGNCTTADNVSFMKTNCPLSCGFC